MVPPGPTGFYRLWTELPGFYWVSNGFERVFAWFHWVWMGSSEMERVFPWVWLGLTGLHARRRSFNGGGRRFFTVGHTKVQKKRGKIKTKKRRRRRRRGTPASFVFRVDGGERTKKKTKDARVAAGWCPRVAHGFLPSFGTGISIALFFHPTFHNQKNNRISMVFYFFFGCKTFLSVNLIELWRFYRVSLFCFRVKRRRQIGGSRNKRRARFFFCGLPLRLTSHCEPRLPFDPLSFLNFFFRVFVCVEFCR